MGIIASPDRLRNFVLIGMLLLVILFTAFHEEYLVLISLFFWGVLLAGFSLALWLAWDVTTRRLLSLMLVISILEYIKETIGIRSGMWVYHGAGGMYNFGVCIWVLGGVGAYTLATRIIIKKLRKLKMSLPRWLNSVILILIASFIPLMLGEYWKEAGGLFFLFYAVLLAICMYASIRMDFPVFTGIVITSWLVGNLSEYLGSVKSGIWTFSHDIDYPPLFLLFGCWPLDIMSQYSLSAFLSHEQLDKDILLKRKE